MLERMLKFGGIPSVCSAHPAVIKETLLSAKDRIALIESTCNQVNQYGGYTGMNPVQFVSYVQRIAAENNISSHKIIFGGDHLGPSVWQNEPADVAMPKSIELVRSYIQAGFTKIHLDCSMRLLDDPAGPIDPQISAKRAAQLAFASEDTQARMGDAGEFGKPRYVIGTEVPIPGGAQHPEEKIQVTRVSDLREMIALHKQAFYDVGLFDAWERVIAVVVQPGVEFGDDFVLAYQPDKARGLSEFIESLALVFEAHSTDYQTTDALRNMVKDHFAILKVGPALTFAYREAIFSLALMETELIPKDERSNIIESLDTVMLNHPEFWKKYYSGTPEEQAYKRKYSLSDRIRYYWVQPEIQRSLEHILKNLSFKPLPFSIVSKFAPIEASVLNANGAALSPQNIISARITLVLNNYWDACEPI